MVEELIRGRADLALAVEKIPTAGGLTITFRLQCAEPCALHWGLVGSPRGSWQAPPESLWPAGTRAFSQGAVQTPFVGSGREAQIELRLPGDSPAAGLAFDLYFPARNRWENNRGCDFTCRCRNSILRCPKSRRSWTRKSRGRR